MCVCVCVCSFFDKRPRCDITVVPFCVLSPFPVVTIEVTSPSPTSFGGKRGNLNYRKLRCDDFGAMLSLNMYIVGNDCLTHGYQERKIFTHARTHARTQARTHAHTHTHTLTHNHRQQQQLYF